MYTRLRFFVQKSTQIWSGRGLFLLALGYVSVVFLTPVLSLEWYARWPVLLVIAAFYVGHYIAQNWLSHLKRWQRSVAMLCCVVVSLMSLPAPVIIESFAQWKSSVSPIHIALCSLGIGAFVAFLSCIDRKDFVAQSTGRYSPYIGLIVVMLCVGVYAFFRLDAKDFHNDEYYHVEAAEGYLNTGDFVLWDFTHQSVYTEEGSSHPQRYTRAYPFTWQVATVVHWFGWSEWVARIPAAAWLVMSAGILYGVVLQLTRRFVLLSALVTIAVFSWDTILLQGRIVRMYSMSMAIALGLYVFGYLILRRYQMHKIIAWRYVIAYLVCVVAAYYTHLMLGVVCLAQGIYAVSVIVRMQISDGQRSRMMRHWAVLGAVIGAGIIGVVYAFTEHELLRTFVHWNIPAHVFYQVMPFIDSRYPLFFLVMYIASCVVLWKRHSGWRYLMLVNAIILVIFIFFIDRYQASRYIVYVIMTMLAQLYVAVGYVVVAFMRYVGAHTVVVSVALIIVWGGMTPWPLYGQTLFFLKSQTQPSLAQDYSGQQFAIVYQYIRDRALRAEPILTIDFRSWYWQDDVYRSVVELPIKKKNKNQLGVLQRSEAFWMVVADGKWDELTTGSLQYIAERGVEHVIPGARMHVYYFPAVE